MESTIHSLTAVSAGDRTQLEGFRASDELGINSVSIPSALDASLFASMMQSTDVSNVAQMSKASSASGPSMIEQLASGHITDLRDLVQSTRDLVSASPNLSMAEIVAAGSEVTLKMTITSTQFSIASAVGKSAANGFQTLMKNQ